MKATLGAYVSSVESAHLFTDKQERVTLKFVDGDSGYNTIRVENFAAWKLNEVLTLEVEVSEQGTQEMAEFAAIPRRGGLTNGTT